MRETKGRFRYGVGSFVVLLAAVCMAFTPAFAQLLPQQGPQDGQQNGAPPEKIAGGFDSVKRLPPGGPAPRTADGHVDLTGRWYPNSAGRMLEGAYPVDRTIFRQFDPKVTPEERPVFKPGMGEKYKSPVPYGVCDQAGTPSTITMQINQHAPIELIQTPGRLALLAEYPLDVRMIYTNGRQHPKDPDPTFNGDSTGRWEGDNTLVVDVIAIDERLGNIQTGAVGEGGSDGSSWLHSDQEHVIERFTRPSKNYLTYQVTIEDPVVLAKPWTSAPRVWSLASPDDEWSEVFCTHNEEPEEIKKIKANQPKETGK